MKLHEAIMALKEFASPDPQIQRRAGEAASVIYERLRNFRSMPGIDASTRDDVIQHVLEKLTRTQTAALANEQAALAYVNTIFNNACKDVFKARKRRAETAFITADSGELVIEDTSIDGADALLEMQQLATQSVILRGEAGDDTDARIAEFVYEHAIAGLARSDARRAARTAFEAMEQLAAGAVTFDDLVERSLGEAASPRERERERNRIQQTHSRARERVFDWAVSQYDIGHLERFDLELVRRWIERLRSRAAPSGGANVSADTPPNVSVNENT